MKFEYEVRYRSSNGQPSYCEGCLTSKREAIGLARSLVAGLPQCSGRMVKVEAFNLLRGGYREHMEPVTVWEWLEHSEGGFGVQVSGRYWENRKAVRL